MLGRWKLSDRSDLTFDDIRDRVERQIDVNVAEVNWFSTYRVHHRAAERFRVGRAFFWVMRGTSSSVGGQGMNTGIGDAINLGWKVRTRHPEARRSVSAGHA